MLIYNVVMQNKLQIIKRKVSCMKKTIYSEAELKIIFFNSEDIVTSSPTDDSLTHVDQSDGAWD